MPKNETGSNSTESFAIANPWGHVFSYLSPQDARAFRLVESCLYALAVESSLTKSPAYYHAWSKQLDCRESMLPHFVKTHVTFIRRLRQLSALIWNADTQEQKVRYARIMRAVISLGLESQDERVSSLAKEKQAAAVTLLGTLKESTSNMRRLGMLPFIAACLPAEQITLEINSALEKLQSSDQLTVNAEEEACLNLACFFAAANEQERQCLPAEVIKQLLNTIERRHVREYIDVRQAANSGLMAICAQPLGDSLTKVIKGLMAAMDDEDEDVHEVICEALQAACAQPLGNSLSSLIDDLLRAMGDDNKNVRYAACKTLQAACGALQATYTQSLEDSLPKVIKGLFAAINDSNASVQLAVNEALQAICAQPPRASLPKVINTLLATINDIHKYAREAARAALQAVCKQPLGDSLSTVIDCMLDASKSADREWGLIANNVLINIWHNYDANSNIRGALLLLSRIASHDANLLAPLYKAIVRSPIHTSATDNELSSEDAACQPTEQTEDFIALQACCRLMSLSAHSTHADHSLSSCQTSALSR